MAFMIYCKVEASLPSNPNGLCLVFLITWNSQSQVWVRSSFIGSHGGRQMFLSVTSVRLGSELPAEAILLRVLNRVEDVL